MSIGQRTILGRRGDKRLIHNFYGINGINENYVNYGDYAVKNVERRRERVEEMEYFLVGDL